MEEMTIYGNPLADTAIVRLLGEHEKESFANETEQLNRRADGTDLCVVAVTIDDWFYEMSPWETEENLFENSAGKKGSGAEEKLGSILDKIDGFEEKYINDRRRFVLAGYSLAGLFALWSGYKTDRFDVIMAASPSVWYPGWTEFIESHTCLASKVYLSLGSKEHKSRNVLMAKVAYNMAIQCESLKKQGIDTTFEMNEGNHFKDVTERMLKGILCCIQP